MKQTKRVLFTFSPYEYKGVEVYLNSLAARGWELVKVGSVLASFRRTQRTDLTYCTDLLTYRRRQGGREAQREYLALCREGGWELVDRRGSMGLFASLPGTNPAPIQTDRDTEWYHYKRAYRNSLFWAVAAILPMLCLVLIILLAGGLATAGEALIRAFRFTWQKELGHRHLAGGPACAFRGGLVENRGLFLELGQDQALRRHPHPRPSGHVGQRCGQPHRAGGADVDGSGKCGGPHPGQGVSSFRRGACHRRCHPLFLALLYLPG